MSEQRSRISPAARRRRAAGIGALIASAIALLASLRCATRAHPTDETRLRDVSKGADRAGSPSRAKRALAPSSDSLAESLVPGDTVDDPERLFGCVVDPDGSPARRFRVSLLDIEGSGGEIAVAEGDAGDFSIAVPEVWARDRRSRVRIEACAGDLRSVPVAWPRGPGPVMVRLEESRTLIARAVTSSGTAAPGAGIRWLRSVRRNFAPWEVSTLDQPWTEQSADTAGELRLSVPVGFVWLSAATAEGEWGPMTKVAVSLDDPDPSVDVPVGMPSVALRIRVLSQTDHSPIAGAEIRLSRDDAVRRSLPELARTRTHLIADAEGRARLMLASGESAAEIGISARGFASGRAWIARTDGREYEFELPRRPVIRLVQTPHGAPFGGRVARITATPAPGRGVQPSVVDCTARPDGMPPERAGDVRKSPGGALEAERAGVEWSQDVHTSDFLLALPSPGSWTVGVEVESGPRIEVLCEASGDEERRYDVRLGSLEPVEIDYGDMPPPGCRRDLRGWRLEGPDPSLSGQPSHSTGGSGRMSIDVCDADCRPVGSVWLPRDVHAVTLVTPGGSQSLLVVASGAGRRLIVGQSSSDSGERRRVDFAIVRAERSLAWAGVNLRIERLDGGSGAPVWVGGTDSTGTLATELPSGRYRIRSEEGAVPAGPVEFAVRDGVGTVRVEVPLGTLPPLTRPARLR